MLSLSVSYRDLQFLFQTTVLHELWPRHAAYDSRHAALAGSCGVGLAELQGAGSQVDLCACARHRVNVEVILLTLQIQSEGNRHRRRNLIILSFISVNICKTVLNRKRANTFSRWKNLHKSFQRLVQVSQTFVLKFLHVPSNRCWTGVCTEQDRVNVFFFRE